MPREQTILVTAVGGDIGQSIIRVLRRIDGVRRIIGVDAMDDHPAAASVDAYCRISRADDPGYLRTIGDVIRRERVDAVIPVSEPEIAILHAAYPGHVLDGIPLLLPGGMVLPTCLDKLETMRVLDRHHVLVPRTVEATSGWSHEYPCILKDRNSWGSKSVLRVDDEAAAAFWAPRRPNGIFQELLLPDEEEYTCGVFRSKTGEVRVIALRRKLDGAQTSKAIVVHDPSIEALCTRIADAFDLQGSMNIQLRKTARGPIPFEINPRFSSTVIFRDFLGFRDVDWSLRDAFDMPLPLMPPLPIGTRIYRVFNEVIVPAGADARVA